MQVSASPLARRALVVGLVAVTAVWGSTFVIVKEAVERVPPFTFLAVRFLLAAVALAVVCLPALRRIGRDGLAHGAALGVALFAGYAFQTIGLQDTTASNAGFVTGMFVVFTPLLSALLLRRPPERAAIVGVGLAAIGLPLLSLTDGFVPRSGDVLVLLCALSFAFHILGLGAWSSRHDAVALTTIQLGVGGVLQLIFAGAVEVGRVPIAWDRYVVVAILITALLASAAAFWVQTAAQRVIPPTRTAVILTMEPVFAGVFGFLLLGERLSGRGWAGAALILAGMLVAELGAGAPPPIPPEDQTSIHDDEVASPA